MMKRLARRIWDLSFRLMPSAIVRRMTAGRLVAPCYHMVSDGRPAHVQQLYSWRGTRAFEADLEYLLKHFTPMSLADLHKLVIECRPLPRNAFLLSFDDGFREMSEIVAPLCRARGIPATFFLTTSFLDNRNLGFRHKASVLMGRYDELGPSRRQLVLARWAKDRQLPVERLADLRPVLSALRYQERGLLDEAARILEIDFNEYLRTERPYMTSEQVDDLVAQGFSIGGHSVDHPLYADLPLRDQIEQTRGCMTALVDRFHPAVRAFAFPFVSDGVPEEFYTEVFSQKIVDLVFCIGALPRKHRQFAFQRFGVESSEHRSLERLLREDVSRHMKARMWDSRHSR